MIDAARQKSAVDHQHFARVLRETEVDQRIDDLITSAAKSRELREVAASYTGNWRDIGRFKGPTLRALA